MAIPGPDFSIWMEANKKLDADETLSAEEQRVIDTHGRRHKNLCGCGCGEELEPRVDGERHTVGGIEVNSDHYFDAFGKEIDEHPIGGFGRRGYGAR